MCSSDLSLPDATYLMWIANKDFPHHVREICGRALETDGAALEAWVKSVYGMPAAEDPAAPEEIGRADTAPIDGSMPDSGPIEPAIERGSDSAREPRPQPVQLGLAI